MPTTGSNATADVPVNLTASLAPTCAAKGHTATWTLKNAANVTVAGGQVSVVITINPPAAAGVPDLANAAYTKPVNSFAAAGWGGNCTAYAWGRMMERTGKKLAPRGDAGTWWSATPVASRSTTPRADSVAVWTGASGSSGHVAFVEKVAIDSKNVTQVTFTEANYSCFSGSWGGGYDGSPKTMTLANFKSHDTGFAGVIF